MVYMNNIYYNHGYYKITKNIKCVTYYLGSYKTFEDAKKYRDDFKKHNWEISYCIEHMPHSNHHKKTERYIYKRNTKYIIMKAHTYYGTFETYTKAVQYKRLLESKNWDKKYIQLKRKTYQHRFPEKKEKYITYNIQRKKWVVQYCKKQKVIYVGAFNKLEDAIKERDFWESINWNMDLIDLY